MAVCCWTSAAFAVCCHTTPSTPFPVLAPLWCCRFEGGLYDRVLLDAPCSSERHVVQAALEAGGVVSSSSWSKEHCSNLAALQLKVRYLPSARGADGYTLNTRTMGVRWPLHDQPGRLFHVLGWHRS
jgi:hypothetical protein